MGVCIYEYPLLPTLTPSNIRKPLGFSRWTPLSAHRGIGWIFKSFGGVIMGGL